jgi:hypothetical protein
MGPSSAGKTSLLRAIRLGFSLLCHRINVHKKKKCEKSSVVDPDPGARKLRKISTFLVDFIYFYNGKV